MDLAADRRVRIACDVFAAWSSGDADAPERFFTPDAVLSDTASGRFEGWPAIREFFAAGLARWKGLVLVPDELWVNDHGVAVHYEMSATVSDPAVYGPEYVGRQWHVEVMSYLRFRGDQVCYEVDVHDRGARARSLGLEPWRGAPPQPDPFRPPLPTWE
ncbi:MAG: nuclear transport factor 2 family protein [Ilumatobacteraceae bacterium]|jgi:ketosteroid isomerase-like protein|nr:nuclear transport factor 2 family protein [Ilumatobacteraceae bacterium]